MSEKKANDMSFVETAMHHINNGMIGLAASGSQCKPSSFAQKDMPVMMYGAYIGSAVGDTAGAVFSRDTAKKSSFVGDSIAPATKGGARSALQATGTLAGASLGRAAEHEYILTRIGVEANLSDQEIQQLAKRLATLSLPESTNKSVIALEQSLRSLMATGMRVDQAEASLRSIGRMSTATGLNMQDLSQIASALTDQLGIAPDALIQGLDALVYASRSGSFSLTDMLQHFSRLAAGAKNFGLQGTDAVNTLLAALQAAQEILGDSSLAADSMASFMNALTSPGVLAAASNAGISIKETMSKAIEQGDNPLDALLDNIQNVTGGDAFKIHEIFNDPQAEQFILSMLIDLEKYKETKKDIAKQSLGTINDDYSKMLKTTTEQALGLANALDRVGTTLGQIFLADASGLIGQLTSVVTSVDSFLQANSELVRMTVLIGGSILALRGLWLIAKATFAALKNCYSGGKTLFRTLDKSFSSVFSRNKRGRGKRVKHRIFRKKLRAPTKSSLRPNDKPSSMTPPEGSMGVAGGFNSFMPMNGMKQQIISTDNGVKQLGKSFTSLPKNFTRAGSTASSLTGVMRGLNLGAAILRGGVKLLGLALRGLAMSNPLGWLGALVDIGTMLYYNWEPFRALVDWIGEKLGAVGALVGSIFGFGSEKTVDQEPQEWVPVRKTTQSESSTDRAKQNAAVNYDAPAGSVPRRSIGKTTQPGSGAVRAMQNTVAKYDAPAGSVARSAYGSLQQTFQHNIEVLIKAPAGFVAHAKALAGSDTNLFVNKGLLMAGAN